MLHRTTRRHGIINRAKSEAETIAITKQKAVDIPNAITSIKPKDTSKPNDINKPKNTTKTAKTTKITKNVVSATADLTWDALIENVNNVTQKSIEQTPIRPLMPSTQSLLLSNSQPHHNVETKLAKLSKIADAFDNADNPKFTLDITDKQTNICMTCGSALYYYDSVLICNNCGEEASIRAYNTMEEEFSTSALTECNVNAYGAMSIKMSGKNSYALNRKLYQTCANYATYRKNTTLKAMLQWNNDSTTHHIPKFVIREANDMFAKIKEHGYVFRKDGKNGVISACLYYRCYANGLTKTPSEIAQFSGIEEKFHSFGDRVLHNLHGLGIVDIPMKINPIADYVERYMELLHIDKKYKPFVVELIERAENKHIHILHDSKNSTKAIGAIYMLIQRVPELRSAISKEKIDAVIGISKTTFMRYYEILCKYYKRIKLVFKKHKIPMPISWRNPIQSTA